MSECLAIFIYSLNFNVPPHLHNNTVDKITQTKKMLITLIIIAIKLSIADVIADDKDLHFIRITKIEKYQDNN